MSLDNGDLTDPLSELLPSLDDEDPELPDDLSAELERLAEATHNDTDGPLVPPGFTLFAVKREAADKLRKAGKDPRLASVRVIAVHNGQKTHTVGRFAPEGLTREALRRKLPAGTYDLQGLTIDRAWVGGRRVHLTDAPSLEPLEHFNGHGPHGSNGQSIGDQLLLKLALRAIDGGGQNRASEMEAATASVLKGLSGMMQMQMADMKMRLMQSEVDEKKTARSESHQLESLKFLATLLKSNGSKPSNGASGMGRFEDFFGALQLGMTLAQGAQGNGKDEDESSLKSWLLPLADSLGPGLISVIAMLLPPDKAKMVSDLLESHFKAREAEARADMSDDPPTMNTEGVPVGGDE